MAGGRPPFRAPCKAATKDCTPRSQAFACRFHHWIACPEAGRSSDDARPEALQTRFSGTKADHLEDGSTSLHLRQSRRGNRQTRVVERIVLVLRAIVRNPAHDFLWIVTPGKRAFRIGPVVL